MLERRSSWQRTPQPGAPRGADCSSGCRIKGRERSRPFSYSLRMAEFSGNTASMRTKNTSLLMICIIVAACDASDDSRARDDVLVTTFDLPDEFNHEPQYGEVERISGRFDHRFEVSAFLACSDRETCEASGAGKCWAEFSQQASQDTTHITGSENFQSEGSFWLEGEGRTANQPGHFGHMNLYQCQIEFTMIEALVPLAD